MALIKNFFKGFFSSKLLILRFVTVNPIDFGLELIEKTCLPHLKYLMVGVFLQGH
jgi:hypothetical protein